MKIVLSFGDVRYPSAHWRHTKNTSGYIHFMSIPSWNERCTLKKTTEKAFFVTFCVHFQLNTALFSITPLLVSYKNLSFQYHFYFSLCCLCDFKFLFEYNAASNISAWYCIIAVVICCCFFFISCVAFIAFLIFGLNFVVLHARGYITSRSPRTCTHTYYVRFSIFWCAVS